MTDQGDTIGALLHDHLREQVQRLHSLDPLVRHHAPDAVHQMRVTVRRLRGVLATGRPFVDRSVTEPVRDELGWLGRSLGEARDVEVLQQRLGDLLDRELGGTDRDGARSLVDAEMRVRSTAARARAAAALDSPRCGALLDRLDLLTVAPPWTEAAAAPAVETATARLRHDWRGLQDRVRVVADAGDVAERWLRLHEARKAAKRLRYTAETVSPTLGKRARRVVKDATRVQSALGDHHDAVLALTTLRMLGERGDEAFTFGVLYAREEQAVRAAEHRFARAWRKASRKHRRRRLLS